MRLLISLALLAATTPALAIETAPPAEVATVALERAPRVNEVLRDTDGRIVGKVYRAQPSGSVLAIVNGETVRIPAGTLSIVNGKLVTTLSKAEALRQK